jgi:hypothetical protein
MSRRVTPLPPDVQALLDREREIPEQPSVVRHRALARARAAITAYPQRSSQPRIAAAYARPQRKRWFIATMLTCAAAAAAGTTAYQLRARFAAPSLPAASVPAPTRPRPAAPAVAAVPAPVAEADAPNVEPAEVAAPTPSPNTETGRPATPLSRADAARFELRLLRPARAAVAHGEFATALTWINEHARRFKDGRLAEEREALRVKALAGLGRTAEARRAAVAFRARFPRSVLLPALSRLAEPPPAAK